MTRNSRINRALRAFAKEVGCHPSEIKVLEPLPGHFAFWYHDKPESVADAQRPYPARPFLSQTADAFAREYQSC